MGLGLFAGFSLRGIFLFWGGQRLSQLFSKDGKKLSEGFFACFLFQLAFPNHMDLPAVSLKGAQVLFVAFDVALEFRLPVFNVLRGCRGVAVGAAMPKQPLMNRHTFLPGQAMSGRPGTFH